MIVKLVELVKSAVQQQHRQYAQMDILVKHKQQMFILNLASQEN